MARGEVTGKGPIAESPYLGMAFVEAHFNRSRSGIYGLVAAGILDAPLKIGRTNVWTRPMIARADVRIMGEQSAATTTQRLAN